MYLSRVQTRGLYFPEEIEPKCLHYGSIKDHSIQDCNRLKLHTSQVYLKVRKEFKKVGETLLTGIPDTVTRSLAVRSTLSKLLQPVSKHHSVKRSTWGEEGSSVEFIQTFYKLNLGVRFSAASFFEPPLVSLSHSDFKSVFDDLSRDWRCSHRLRWIMETRLKYQPRLWEGGGQQAYITQSSKCICKHFMSMSFFSVWRLACGPSGDPSLLRSICSCLLHRKSGNVLQSTRLCTSLLRWLSVLGIHLYFIQISSLQWGE